MAETLGKNYCVDALIVCKSWGIQRNPALSVDVVENSTASEGFALSTAHDPPGRG
jgi:hypothetical protein